MSSEACSLYPFHKANIHERRFVAKAFAAVPLLCIVVFFHILGYGLLRNPHALLMTCAIFNVTTWLWIVTTVLLSIVGVSFMSTALYRAKRRPTHTSVNPGCLDGMDSVDKVVHLIVLPNYKEDEDMLAETLQSLSEADEHEDFCIVLAMEEHEALSVQKGHRLQQRFEHAFGGIVVTVHPMGLAQKHLDESIDLEVPGKASNLKWAVPQGFEEFEKMGLLQSRASTILTVADADCIFHPGYFKAVSSEFNMLRENPGNDHLWTMYQAPQLPYRKFVDSIACCRIWAYVSSAYELAGVCSLSFGGTHMTFSGYSLPLQLALEAGAWDGDVIAEDHHAFLKCFFYSAFASVGKSDNCVACVPQLKVRPVYLPAKSTSVSSESYWRTSIDRWWQAKRHAQGAAELSYTLLAAFDAMCTIPWKSQSFAFYWQVGKLIVRLLCMHLLATCQGVSLIALSAVWIYHGQSHPSCPTNVHFANVLTKEYPLHRYLICSLSGAWVLVWPTVVVTALVVVANYLILSVAFLRGKASRRAESVWYAEDGGAPRASLTTHVSALVRITFDCVFLLSAFMVPYGFFANTAAYIDIAIYGNRVKYMTATKPKTTTTYGTLSAKLLGRPGRCPGRCPRRTARRPPSTSSIGPPSSGGTSSTSAGETSESSEEVSTP